MIPETLHAPNFHCLCTHLLCPDTLEEEAPKVSVKPEDPLLCFNAGLPAIHGWLLGYLHSNLACVGGRIFPLWVRGVIG